MKINNEYKGYLKHFSKGISKEIKEYATKEVFKHSRYIFTHRKGKHQYGYCTYCHNEFETKGLKHNKETQCPKCKSDCTVKASGIKRRWMIDEAYFVYYEKSAINPKVIVARGIYAVRDYTGDYHEVKTKYQERARYIFEMGNSVMLHRYGYYSMAKNMKTWETFNKQKTVYSLYGNYHNNSLNVIKECSHESIRKAVSNTPFRYSTWESYADGDMVKFFDLYSRYPCIEYLSKLGFNDMVESKLSGGRTYSAINWNGNTLFKVLRISKKELNDLKKQKIKVTYLFLRFELYKGYCSPGCAR